MKTFDSPASTILVTNSDGTKYDIGRSPVLKNLDVHALDPRLIDRDAHRRVLDAAPGEKAEMLLVDRRGDDQLAVEVADDAAREHVRAGERVAIADGMDFLINAKQSNLFSVDQGGDAG